MAAVFNGHKRQSLPRPFMAGFMLAYLLVCGWRGSGQAREITDMLGRKVKLPDNITRIYTPSPVGFQILYTLNPDLLCGRLFPLRDSEKEMLLPQIRQLPLLGSLTGEGGLTANKELLFSTQFDIILMVVRDENGIFLDPLAGRAE